VYYVGPNGRVFDDGFGDQLRAYGVDLDGRRYALLPEVEERLTARYMADHPPMSFGALSAERVAAIRSRFPIGDAIAKVTSAVGIQPCAPCKKRQAALNALGDRFARAFR